MKYNEITDGTSVTDTAVYPEESVQDRRGDIDREINDVEKNLNSLMEEVNVLCSSISKVLTPENKTESEGDKIQQYECVLAEDLQCFNNTINAIRDRVISATRRVEL